MSVYPPASFYGCFRLATLTVRALGLSAEPDRLVRRPHGVSRISMRGYVFAPGARAGDGVACGVNSQLGGQPRRRPTGQRQRDRRQHPCRQARAPRPLHRQPAHLLDERACGTTDQGLDPRVAEP